MSTQCETAARRAAGAEMPFFEAYLSLWVALSVVWIVNRSKGWYEARA